MDKLKRVVIKIGTKVLTSKERALDRERIKDIVGEVSDMKDKGIKVLLVTSGAIGAGMGLLGMKRRPSDLSSLQAAASIGQSHLMHIYSEYFKARGYLVGQMLLTQEDFNDRKRYLNIKDTIQSLIEHNVVPIINENDTVSTEEIKCGDNDRLAGLVSDLCGADMLIILTDVDGLMDEDGSVIRRVDDLNQRVMKLARVIRCDIGTGGMATKLESIKAAMEAGIECVVANGRKSGTITRILKGEDVGTVFKSGPARLIAKTRWIAFSSRPKGAVQVDDGAKEAILKDKSLLASGITHVSGSFSSGEVVKILDKDLKDIARGVSGYSSSDLSKIKGRRTGDFKAILGHKGPGEAIHKDDLVIL
jgi:glutamate 5-kinase